MAVAGTLPYVEKNAPTRVVVDVSPAGLRALLMWKQNSANCLFAVQATASECECKYFQTEIKALALF